jgi:hypothetical protein
MPKITVEYNLPEEQDEFETANNASKYYSVLWDLDQYLRNITKYASNDTTEDQLTAYYALRDEFHKLMVEHNVTLD